MSLKKSRIIRLKFAIFVSFQLESTQGNRLVREEIYDLLEQKRHRQVLKVPDKFCW